MRKLLLITLFLSLHLFISASEIAGFVIEKETSEALPFATISLYQKGQFISGGYADDLGFYKFKDLIKGDYEIQVSYIGFIDLKQNVKLQSGIIIVDDFKMDLESNLLPEITITGYKTMHANISRCSCKTITVNCYGYRAEMNSLDAVLIPEIETRKDDPAVFVFPNPTSQVLNIRIMEPYSHFIILNSNGQMIHQKASNEMLFIFSVIDLPAGMYFIIIQNENRVLETKKFTVIKD